MRIVRLRISNFRCVRSAELFPTAQNVLLGPNNTGKTGRDTGAVWIPGTGGCSGAPRMLARYTELATGGRWVGRCFLCRLRQRSAKQAIVLPWEGENNVESETK